MGLGSAGATTTGGEGSTLPADVARRLVFAGPYRVVRSPMAVAGVEQGVAGGLMLSAGLVMVDVLCGSLIWNTAVRPIEEADLAQRFGEEYADYRRRVSCWVPRLATSPT